MKNRTCLISGDLASPLKWTWSLGSPLWLLPPGTCLPVVIKTVCFLFWTLLTMVGWWPHKPRPKHFGNKCCMASRWSLCTCSPAKPHCRCWAHKFLLSKQGPCRTLAFVKCWCMWQGSRQFLLWCGLKSRSIGVGTRPSHLCSASPKLEHAQKLSWRVRCCSLVLLVQVRTPLQHCREGIGLYLSTHFVPGTHIAMAGRSL